jgi:hypothetical protein
LKKGNVTKTTKEIKSVMFYKKTIKNAPRIFSCNLVEISTSRRQETIKKIFWSVACTTKISTFQIHNGCFSKFGVKVGVEESIVYAPPDYNSDQLTSLFGGF